MSLHWKYIDFHHSFWTKTIQEIGAEKRKHEKPVVIFLRHVQVTEGGGSRISQTGESSFQNGGANLLYGQIFPENCMKMKMKEFGPGRGRGNMWSFSRSGTSVDGQKLSDGSTFYVLVFPTDKTILSSDEFW